MIRPIRRVVAGAGDDGASRIIMDSVSPHVHTLPGMPDDLGLTDLWHTGPEHATAGTNTAADAADREFTIAPDPGGTLFRVVQFPPDAELPAGPDGEPAVFWHATETVDYNVLLDGEITFLTEHGETALRPGDTLIVRGGRHAWSNRTATPAVLAAVSVHGGPRADGPAGAAAPEGHAGSGPRGPGV